MAIRTIRIAGGVPYTALAAFDPRGQIAVTTGARVGSVVRSAPSAPYQLSLVVRDLENHTVPADKVPDVLLGRLRFYPFLEGLLDQDFDVLAIEFAARWVDNEKRFGKER